jgi:hypothetical protein
MTVFRSRVSATATGWLAVAAAVALLIVTSMIMLRDW